MKNLDFLNKSRERKKFSSKRRWVVLGSFGAMILLLVAFSIGENSLLGGFFGGVFTSVQQLFTNMAAPITQQIEESAQQANALEQNRVLQAQVESLQTENRLLEEQRAENERLTELLGLKEAYGTNESVAARVIAKNTDPYFQVFLIDKGSYDGITQNMAVLHGDGLVGRIVEVAPTWSRVLAMIDGRSGVSAIVSRTRDQGIVRGSLDTMSDMCRMVYVASDADVMPGDQIVTSGLGGVYPKGVLIGEVTEVSLSEDTEEQYLLVKPAVNFLSVEEVLVVSVGEDVPEVEE